MVEPDVEMVSVAVEVDRRNEASNSQTKRKAEDADSIGEHKKARTGEDDCLFFCRIYLIQIYKIKLLQHQKGLHFHGDDRFALDSRRTWIDRDRENSTVFVSNLPPEVTDDDLKRLFKDVSYDYLL